ncbi:MAG TPA: TolC family protein [Cyclobacteriaceae bacterium]|nr:TolC family protein [Cyclobacteriaceae bacterium]
MRVSQIAGIALILAVFTLSLQAQQMVSLNDVIQLSLEKDYGIHLAQNALSAAETDEQYSFGALLPRINATASKTWNNNNQKQLLPDNTERKRDGIKSENISASGQLQWLLFDGTRMFATRERISEVAAQGELLLLDQMVNTVASVINNYYFIVALKQQLKATQEQMAVSEERVKLAELKLEVGTGGKPELLQAKIDLNSQRRQVVEQRTAIHQVKDQLNGLVGMQLPEGFDVADTILIDLGLDREEVIGEITRRNFELQALRKNIDISHLTIRERKGELFPFLYFNTNYNFSKTENEVAINNFTPLFNQNQGFNYGFSLTFPILNGFDTRRRIRLAHIDAQRQQILYDQRQTEVMIEANNAFDNYNNARELMRIGEETILLARENVYIALEGFKRGVTTFIELRTAQISLEAAYTELINARYNAKVAETELLRLCGRLVQTVPGDM